MALIEVRNVATWDGTETQQAQSCAATSNTTLTLAPTGARRVIFTVLNPAGSSLSIHNSSNQSEHLGVLIGGLESYYLEFLLDPSKQERFYCRNEGGSPTILGALYFKA